MRVYPCDIPIPVMGGCCPPGYARQWQIRRGGSISAGERAVGLPPPGRRQQALIHGKGEGPAARAAARSEEQLVGGVIRLVPVRIADFGQESLEQLLVRRRDLDADQDAPVVRTLVAVVEQADVPVGVH